MKKIISIMLSIVMAFTMLSVPVTVMANTELVDGNDVEYQVTGGYIYFDEATGTITGCDENVTEANIPAKINNITVTSIGDSAFYECRSLTSIAIPDSVTSIGSYAFHSCSSLTNITMPDSVTSIGEGAFSWCYSLTSIDVEEGNKDYASKEGCLFNGGYTILIAYPAGNECSSYTIPNSVTSIKNCAFSGCYSLTNITIPDSVTSIGDVAFSGCRSLKSITIPDSVTSIGDVAFSRCENLKSITIPDSVVSIGNNLFFECYGLKSITIPDSVTSIGNVAFYGCYSLTSITIPDSVTSIGNEAFSNCSGLTSITIPDSVTSIGNWAFSDCSGLTSITIPDSVTSIGDDAFCECDNLTIYGYSGSYAETYAKEMNIKFVALGDGSIRTSEPLNISEDDLFGEYAEYLYNNEAYKALLSNLYGTFEKASYKTSDDLSSAVKLSMITVGSFDIIRYVKLMAGIDDTDEKIEEEMAVEILRGAENHSDTLKYFLEKVENNYKWTSRIQTVVSGGLESESATVQLAQFLGSGSLFSDTAALKVIKVLKKDAVGDGLAVAGYAVNVAQLSCEVVMTMEVNHEILTTMMDNVSKNSTLYGGLESIEQKQKKSLEGNLAESLAKDFIVKEMAQKMVKEGLKHGSGAFKYVGLSFVLAAELFIPVSADDKVKVLVADGLCASLRSAVQDKSVEIKLDYDNNNGKNKEKLKAEYRMLFDVYMQSIKNYKKCVCAVADPETKAEINRVYEATEKYLSYDKYIESCLRNANTGWRYRVKDGKAVVMGTNDAAKVSRKAISVKDLIIEPVYAGNSEAVLIGIPEKVGSYEVVGIGKDAMKDNTKLDVVCIPASVDTIGRGAFSGCTSLDMVLMGQSVNTIEANSFSGCNSLAELELPYSVENIGEGAFNGVNGIRALPGSAGAEYAGKNNIKFAEKDLDYVNLEITKEPNKRSYNVDEELDVSGIEVIATGEDGRREDVSGNIYYEFEDKKIGQNKVNVYFNDLSASYDVEVLAGECKYTVSYEDEFGDEIAEKYEGTASVGEEIELPTPDIEGYTSDKQENVKTIGIDNDFIVSYTSIPKKLISEAKITYPKEAKYTGKQIKPDVEIKYAGEELIQDEDYIIDYDANTEPGLGGMLIQGRGDYSGYQWIDFEIKKSPNAGNPAGTIEGNTQELENSNGDQGGGMEEKAGSGEKTGIKTGDGFNMHLYVMLVCLALIGVVGSLLYKKGKQ